MMVLYEKYLAAAARSASSTSRAIAPRLGLWGCVGVSALVGSVVVKAAVLTKVLQTYELYS